MCCTRLARNAGHKKIAKNSPSGHYRTICRAIFSQLRHILTIEKTCLNSNISLTCIHNMVIFGPLTAEIRWRVWGTPANFNRFRVSLLGFVTAATSPNAANQICTTFGRLLGWYTMYIFSGGSCLVTEFCHVRPSLAFSYIGSVTARYSSSGRQRKFAASYKEWNYGTFAEGATYTLFGWAAITLGICPQSSYGRCMEWGRPLYFCLVVSSIFFVSTLFFSLPNFCGHKLDVYHTSTHGVAFLQI